MKKALEKRKVETSVRDVFLVEQRRDEIVRAASKVFAQKGYHQATIRDISLASGLGPGTIYNYVKKKEDILYLVYSKLTSMFGKRLAEAIEKNDEPFDQLVQVLREIIEIAWNYQDLIILMYQETAALDKESMYDVLKKESEYVVLLDQLIAKGVKTGIIKNKNYGLGADIIAYLLAFIPLRRWNLKPRFNEDEIKSGLIDFILNGLGISKDEDRKKSGP